MPDPRPRRILVVDLLGGLGDLVMVLPVVHALSRRYPHAELCVLTHPPGDALLRHDPAVTTVTRAVRGAERLAVVGALDRFRPDLVVSTTRYDGIAAEIEARGVRSVTDLWRNPPPDERVFERYQRILAAEGVIDDDIQHPRVVLTHAERVTGQRLLAEYVPSGSPVVVIPSAGMEVKDWPYWLALVRMIARRRDPPLIVGEPGGAANLAARTGPATACAGTARLGRGFRRGGYPRGSRCRSGYRTTASSRGCRGPHDWPFRADPGQSVWDRPVWRGPAGPFGVPIPITHRGDRTGVLVARALSAIGSRSGVHGRDLGHPCPRGH